jgi:WD40 repeat protein
MRRVGLAATALGAALLAVAGGVAAVAEADRLGAWARRAAAGTAKLLAEQSPLLLLALAGGVLLAFGLLTRTRWTSTRIAICAAVVLVVAVGCWFGFELRQSNLGRGDQLGSVVSMFVSLMMAPVTLASLVVSTKQWRESRRAATGHQQENTTTGAGAPAVDGAGGPDPAVPWLVPHAEEVALPRPELAEQLLRLLGGPSSQTVAVTIALVGAGGFGKTTLAMQVGHDEQVVRRFPGGALWLTVGRHTDGPQLATKINDLSAHLTRERPPLGDPEQAGLHLGRLLEDRADTLLVIDDVWTSAQLRPLLAAGATNTRLIITRIPGILPPNTATVLVDEMDPELARGVLTAGLPALAEDRVEALLELTGRWPLLLRLANSRLLTDVAGGVDVDTGAHRLATRLRTDGPATLDLGDEQSRERAVRASVLASVDGLSEQERQRFLELAIFTVTPRIPRSVLLVLWHASGRLQPNAVDRLCERLADRSLLMEYNRDTLDLRLHDVIRAYLRSELGDARTAAAHRTLVDGAAHLCAGDAEAGFTVAWWRLPADAAYWWRHLGHHLVMADRRAELERLVVDLRWIDAKLHALGPVAVETDLAMAEAPTAALLGRAIGQAAHLLTPIEPRAALTDVLLSRLDGIAELAPAVDAYTAHRPARPRLRNRWPLPDQPDPALRRVLTGHVIVVTSCAVDRSGTRVLTTGHEGRVCIWDPETGTLERTLDGHTASVMAGAWAADGSWLVTAGYDRTARIWNHGDGSTTLVLTGHERWITDCAVAPCGTWLVTTGGDGTARIWDARTGAVRRTLTGHDGGTEGCAIAPNGEWLVTVGADHTARIWSVDADTAPLVLEGHRRLVNDCAIASDGSWLATASGDGTIRTWDATTGAPRAELVGHVGSVAAVAIAPDDSLIVSAGQDGTVRLWDPITGAPRRVLRGHTDWVTDCAFHPQLRWIVTTGKDGVVRIWDRYGSAPPSPHRPDGGGSPSPTPVEAAPFCASAPTGAWIALPDDDGTAVLRAPDTGAAVDRLATGAVTTAVAVSRDATLVAAVSRSGQAYVWPTAALDQPPTVLTGHLGSVGACAVHPAGAWVVTGGDDATVRIWLPDSAVEQRVLHGHTDRVTGCVIAPDGTWLATTSADGTTRIWDPTTGEERQLLRGHVGSVSGGTTGPDGSWLATSGADGTLRIWQVSTGTQTAIMACDMGLSSCASTPDGTLIATTGDDGAVRVWSVRTHRPVTAMRVDGTVTACCWSVTGLSLCAVGNRGAYLFDYEPGQVDQNEGRDQRADR